MIDQAPAGSRWAVGTECHLVRRLAADHPEQTIVELSDTPAGCTQMGRVDLPHLLWCLDSIVAGDPVNIVRVDEKTATDARLSLDRMIQIPRVTK
jgi:quinolinate synthase